MVEICMQCEKEVIKHEEESLDPLDMFDFCAECWDAFFSV